MNTRLMCKELIAIIRRMQRRVDIATSRRTLQGKPRYTPTLWVSDVALASAAVCVICVWVVVSFVVEDVAPMILRRRT